MLDTSHEPKIGIIGRDRCVLGYPLLGLYEGKIRGERILTGAYTGDIYTALRLRRVTAGTRVEACW